MFTAVRDDAASSGTEIHHPYESFDLALVACAAGDFAAAGAHVREGIEAARDAEDAYGERLLLYPLALVHAWRGRAAEARAAAAQRLREAGLKHDRPGVVRARGVLGLLALSEGECTVAARELAEAARLLHAMGFAHPGAFPVLPDAVEALAGAGQHEAADALLARLARQAAAVDSAWARAAAARSRGALLLARGDAKAAGAPLEHAVSAFERLGHRPDAARARFLHGRALLRAGRRNAAADALTGAREAFAAMGAATWEARAAHELERAAPGRRAGTLTPAERRIAALVAEGMRNREICQALFMSVGTVEAHLTRMYRKLGIRSRSELARLVAGGGLE
jgi:DNA-binding CsgD family transcriptional regulator